MLLGRIALFFALLFGVAASQGPEFVQQYRQRLGGAVDELVTIVDNFNADAAKEGLSQAQGIARLKDNADPFVQTRGVQMEGIVERLRVLSQAQADLAAGGPLGQTVAFLRDFDSRIARRAYGTYQPAVPVTWEGFVAGIAGFLVGGGLIHLLGRPFRRRRQPGFVHYHRPA